MSTLHSNMNTNKMAHIFTSEFLQKLLSSSLQKLTFCLQPHTHNIALFLWTTALLVYAKLNILLSVRCFTYLSQNASFKGLCVTKLTILPSCSNTGFKRRTKALVTKICFCKKQWLNNVCALRCCASVTKTSANPIVGIALSV